MIKKIWFLLDNPYKIYGIFLIIVLLVSSVLETLSIALIVPVVDIIFSNKQSENFILNFFFNYFNQTDDNQIVTSVLIIFFLTFLFKNIFLLFFSFLNTSYVNYLRLELCKKLFDTYTSISFQILTDENKSFKIRNIQNEVGLVSKTVYQILNVLNEILVIFVIGILLIYSDPKSTLISFSIVVFAFFILSIGTKNYLKNLGIKRAFFANISTKSLLDFFEGLKHIKIFDKEPFFKNRFVKNEKRLIKLNIITGTLKAFPRLYYEAIAIIIISIVIYLNTNISAQDSTENLGKFALFLAAALRIMPSFNRLSQAFQNINYNKKSIDIVNKELKIVRENQEKNKINFNNNIKFSNLAISYGEKEILKDFNFTIKFGEKYLLKGPNGSGKSTLLSTLMGLMEVTKGSIWVDERKINFKNESWKENLGYASNENFFYEGSIAENICFGENIEDINLSKLEETIKFVELSDFVSKAKDQLYSKINQSGLKISEGEKQKIALARAIYRSPKILILDEALSSIDEASVKKIMQNFSDNKNLTVIYISHEKDFSNYFDNQNIINLK